jgi:mitogen-activated protein kinase 15
MLVRLQAYGVVWKAVDKKNQNLVALKKIFDAFQNATDAQVWHTAQLPDVSPRRVHAASWQATEPWLSPCVHLQRTFREIMFLQDLNNHENIIR